MEVASKKLCQLLGTPLRVGNRDAGFDRRSRVPSRKSSSTDY